MSKLTRRSFPLFDLETMLATTNGVHLRQPSPFVHAYFVTLPPLEFLLHYLGMDREAVRNTRNVTDDASDPWVLFPNLTLA